MCPLCAPDTIRRRIMLEEVTSYLGCLTFTYWFSQPLLRMRAKLALYHGHGDLFLYVPTYRPYFLPQLKNVSGPKRSVFFSMKFCAMRSQRNSSHIIDVAMNLYDMYLHVHVHVIHCIEWMKREQWAGCYIHVHIHVHVLRAHWGPNRRAIFYLLPSTRDYKSHGLFP